MKAVSAHQNHRHGRDAHGRAGDTHGPRNFGPPFAIGTILNLGFVILEAVYGVWANSLALVADAGHNFGDALSLVMAWTATVLARRVPSQTHTYGLRRGTILAALANAMLLMVGVGAIAIEGMRRLVEPGEVAGMTVIVVAAAGIVVNGVTACLFASGRKADINLRAAFLHMTYDALVSLGVVVTGVVILLTGWTRLDPLVSLAIAVIILMGTWSLLREAVGMSLDAVPVGITTKEVRSFLERQPGVNKIHDLHVWPISTTETALSCHCLMPGGHPGDEFLVQLAHELHGRFGIGHATIQVEVDERVFCALEPDHTV
jgi:cobalt-zinc-cadmium efflux system protein